MPLIKIIFSHICEKVRTKLCNSRMDRSRCTIFVDRRVEALKQVYTILHGFVDPFQHPPTEQFALNQPESFDITSLEGLDESMLSTFPEEDGLKEKSTTRFWNPFLMRPCTWSTNRTGFGRLYHTREQIYF